MRLILFCLLLPVALGACSTTQAASAGADSEVAADAVDDAAPADASGTDAASDVADANADAADVVDVADSVDIAADVSPLGPATWTGIYTDYFGPNGVAGCAGPACHTSTDQSGYVVSKFICPDQATCYASLTGTSKMVLPTDAANPTKSKLMRNLRQVGNAGKMPSGSAFVFSTADAARIAKWIAGGAKND